MSEINWPKFEARNFAGRGVAAGWVVEAVVDEPNLHHTLGKIIVWNLTEPEARAMAAALNLAREARELADSCDEGKAVWSGNWEQWFSPDARTAYEAAKAKETQ